MLAFYAECLPTVEINNTFYRMPKAWVLETGPRPRRGLPLLDQDVAAHHAHGADEAGSADSVATAAKNLEALGEKKGAVLSSCRRT
jgi:hypothetical protein